MRLKEYYNKEIEGIEKNNENSYNIIADYLSHCEMNEEDLTFMHSLDYNAIDFLDIDCTDEEFYTRNDLFLIIDYYYDTYDNIDYKHRIYNKWELEHRLTMLKWEQKALSNIIENYAD